MPMRHPSSPAPRPNRRPVARHSRTQAFSLVELLIVMLLSALLLALAYQLMLSNMLLSRQGISRTVVYANARAVRNMLAQDFKGLMGPRPNPVTTPYPDRDPATLAPALDTGLSRGALVVVPGVRQGTLPESNGKTVNLRCDQVFFLVDTQWGGAKAVGGQNPPNIGAANGDLVYHSATRPGGDAAVPNAGASTQAAVWIGPVTDTDSTTNALTWALGRQVVLLNDQDGLAPYAKPFTGTTDLSPLAAARKNSDLAPYSLQSVSDWIMGLAPLGKRSPPLAAATDPQVNTLINAFMVPIAGKTAAQLGDPAQFQWPKVDSSPLSDNAVTAADATNPHRLLLRHCSECVIQVALDNNCNGLADTTNKIYDPTADPANPAYQPLAANRDGKNMDGSKPAWDAKGFYDDSKNRVSGTSLSNNNPAKKAPDGTGYNPTGLNRDLAGDLVWTPTDQAVNDLTNPKHPFAFWPQDAQPRIVHFGYFQGPTNADGMDLALSNGDNIDGGKTPVGVQRYWKNAYGDWTPYPPIPYTLSDGADRMANFGDYILLGEYGNGMIGAGPARFYHGWDDAIAYQINDMVNDWGDPGNGWQGGPPGTAGNWSDHGHFVYRALAAGTGTALGRPGPGNPNWAKSDGLNAVAAGKDQAETDYRLAMQNYAAAHGWNPTTQRGPVGGPATVLADQPPPPQSAWPTLIRIRLRLHDSTGVLKSYMDDFSANHRNDNGDPARPANTAAADSPAECRASGVWFEYIFPLPYPRLQNPQAAGIPSLSP